MSFSFHFSGFGLSVRLWNLAAGICSASEAYVTASLRSDTDGQKYHMAWETAGQSSSLTMNWGNGMLNKASLNWEGLLQMVQPQTVKENLDSTLMYVSSDTSGCVVQKVMMGCSDYKLQ